MSATQEKAAGTIVACPHCNKKNRVRPVPRGTPRCGSCHKALPWLVEATTATFDQEVESSVPVLVDLWAPWCGPCKVMAPALEQIARERAGRLKVVKVNVDQEPALSQRYQVQGIPQLVLLRDGKELARRTGAMPPGQIQAWLNSQLTLHSAGAAEGSR
jgi:thioredoxin 2